MVDTWSFKTYSVTYLCIKNKIKANLKKIKNKYNHEYELNTLGIRVMTHINKNSIKLN